MEWIKVNQVIKTGNTIGCDFEVSGGLACYFSGKPFTVEYCVNIEQVPDAIAVIPFVCSVLPIIWLTDARLIVEELDKAFWECLPLVKGGYETMFPESTFAGEIQCADRVSFENPSADQSAVFFSGGLDAVHTLVTHLQEKPALICIWGADIRFENRQGWEKVHRGISAYAEQYGLTETVIRSSFREFDNEGLLHREFYERLQDGWWHGVKHSLGLLGHSAPYAYLFGISTVYLASSNCPQDGPVRCASNPLTDDHVRFGFTRVVHDGFAFSRQDKLRSIVKYANAEGARPGLRVCWESQSGRNCCRCEKCFRTMAGLVAEGALPEEYGFEDAPRMLGLSREYMIDRHMLSQTTAERHWLHIQAGMRRNLKTVKRSPYWKAVRWMLNADFSDLTTIKPPLGIRIRMKLSRFRFYQWLHEIKLHITGKYPDELSRTGN